MPTDPSISARLARIDTVAPDPFDQRISFKGLDFDVAANIFNPAKGRSARMLSEAVELCPPSTDSRILDVGTGSGVMSMLLWMRGCRFIAATDIMSEACACANANFAAKGMKIPVYQRDLLDGADPNVDYVLFNAPASHPDRFTPAIGATTLWGPDDLKSRFVSQLRSLNRKASFEALFMYSSLKDYDPLASVDFSGFKVSRLLIDKDKDAEAGVILLTL